MLRTTLALLLLALPATADPLTGSTTLGVVILPEYEGSDRFQTLPLIGAKLNFGTRYIELQGTSLRANLLTSPALEAGPLLTYRFGRDQGDIALPEVEDALELGAFLAYTLPIGQGALRLSADLTQDVGDSHGGWVGTLGAGYGRALSDRLSLSATLSATVVSDDYADSFFSVTPAGAATSGLAAYTARGGLKDIGLDIGISHALSERTSLDGFVSYRRLLGDFADSPVTRAGSADQITLGLALTRKF